jgi:UMF1 family MFS transporter
MTAGAPAMPATVAPATPRERIAWALNDVANSAFSLVIITAVFPLYFAGVIVGPDAPPGRADQLWGYGIAISMALVAVSSPLMGTVADRLGWRKQLLFAYTLVGALATASLAALSPGDIALGLALLIIANIAFEGSLVFYDALLPSVATPAQIGRWSGIGWASGYLGSIFCLGLAAVFAAQGRLTPVFFIVATWWLAFSLPLFALVRDRAPRAAAAPAVFASLAATFRRIRQSPSLSRFFLAFFLYNDGIATTIAFAALYATTTLGFAQTEVLILLAVVQVSGAVGAFGFGLLADRIGHARTIVITLVIWCGVVVTAAFVTEKTTFWFVALAVGSVMGATQSASRGFLASVASAADAGELFGFKAVAGKFSAVLGPLIFGAVSRATGNQRYALLAVGLLFIAGTALMLTVDEHAARRDATAPPRSRP